MVNPAPTLTRPRPGAGRGCCPHAARQRRRRSANADLQRGRQPDVRATFKADRTGITPSSTTNASGAARSRRSPRAGCRPTRRSTAKSASSPPKSARTRSASAASLRERRPPGEGQRQFKVAKPNFLASGERQGAMGLPGGRHQQRRCRAQRAAGAFVADAKLPRRSSYRRADPRSAGGHVHPPTREASPPRPSGVVASAPTQLEAPMAAAHDWLPVTSAAQRRDAGDQHGHGRSWPATPHWTCPPRRFGMTLAAASGRHDGRRLSRRRPLVAFWAQAGAPVAVRSRRC